FSSSHSFTQILALCGQVLIIQNKYLFSAHKRVKNILIRDKSEYLQVSAYGDFDLNINKIIIDTLFFINICLIRTYY
ncbi:MAG: hypothetical protein NC244_13395, partial [Alistipes senegalensis]|nr:hypothetical protein [Alistipes senegalensis]